MAFHPRENWDPTTGRRTYSRRDFLLRAGALGLSVPALSSILAACGSGSDATTTTRPSVAIGTPKSPVTQPLFDDNQAIASGLSAEDGPLKIYNWADYLSPDILPVAEEALGTKIELSTFYNEEEALQKLTSGEVKFDVWFPVASTVSKAVAAKLVQPINHDYIPNLDANVWPSLANPYYDQGSQYTVPYTVYQTGIAWRNDRVDDADVMTANPWDVFWNEKYKGITGLYDDFRETLAMTMFRNGVTDTRNATQDQLDAAVASLQELIGLMNIRYTIDGVYTGIPEDKFGLHEAWSGDVVATPYYFPEGADPSVMRYMWPGNAEGSTVNGHIANDTMTVLKGAEHPVLAHQFLNFMLDPENAVNNFGWVGYQPPQKTLDPDSLVADEWVPEYLKSAIVREGDFDLPRAEVPTQLPPEVEAQWLDAWSQAQNG